MTDVVNANELQKVYAQLDAEKMHSARLVRDIGRLQDELHEARYGSELAELFTSEGDLESERQGQIGAAIHDQAQALAAMHLSLHEAGANVPTAMKYSEAYWMATQIVCARITVGEL